MSSVPAQQSLQLEVVVAKDVDGLEMGVLHDGTPYLTGRSVARLCGVAPSAIIKQADNWNSGNRDGKFAQFLIAHDFEGDSLYIVTKHGDLVVHAYPDWVCMAFLEYYAFEAVGVATDKARKHYRDLGRRSLKTFIYDSVGYDPSAVITDSWRHFHDRLVLHQVPTGYFNVFRETADIAICAIQRGLRVDHHTVPDISVGRAWSAHWTEQNLEQVHGERKKWMHNYPDYYPQSASNPQDVFIYPVEALGEFRRWMQYVYLREKFPAYLKTKERAGAISSEKVVLLLAAVEPPEMDLLP